VPSEKSPLAKKRDRRNANKKKKNIEANANEGDEEDGADEKVEADDQAAVQMDADFIWFAKAEAHMLQTHPDHVDNVRRASEHNFPPPTSPEDRTAAEWAAPYTGEHGDIPSQSYVANHIANQHAEEPVELRADMEMSQQPHSTDSQTRERDQEDDRRSHKKLKALPTRTRGAPVHSGSLAHLM